MVVFTCITMNGNTPTISLLFDFSTMSIDSLIKALFLAIIKTITV